MGRHRQGRSRRSRRGVYPLSRLPRATGAEVLRALQRGGFALVDVNGSHHHLEKPGTASLVTVPVHAGRTILPKVMSSILRQAGLSADDFRALL